MAVRSNGKGIGKVMKIGWAEKAEKCRAAKAVWRGRKSRGKTGRRLAGMAAILSAAALAAGCGQSKGATTAQREFVYLPEYVKVQMEDNLEQIRAVGDTVYFVSGLWDDASNTYQKYMGKIESGKTEPERILLDIGEEENMLTANILDDGSLVAVVNTYIYDDEAEGAADGESAASDAGTAQEGEETENDVTDTADSQEAVTGQEPEEAGETKTEESVQSDDGESAAEDAQAIEDSDETMAASEEISSTTVISGGTVGYASASFSTGSSAASTFTDGDYRVPSGEKRELWKIGADGKVTEKTDLEPVLEGRENFYAQYLAVDKDGNVFIAYDQDVIVIDQAGKKLFDLKVDNWINALFAVKDGPVLLAYWGDGIEVRTIDVQGKKIGDAVEGMEPIQYRSCTFAQGAGSDLLISSDNKLYRYSFNDKQLHEILNWIDCDIDESSVSSFTTLEDGRVLAITSSWNGERDINEMELAYLTKKKGSEAPEKKLLTYGTLMLDYNVRKKILEFNRMNQEYRIEVKEYFTDYEGENAYADALQRMNADIVSGKCPDIIDLSSNNMNSYIAKGVVEDLYPFMEKDPEINREDYLENVLRAYENDGKLYALPSDFYISTIMAKVSDVGDKQRITLDEIMELAKSMPEGTELFQYASKSSILNNILRMNKDVFVDWNTGECKFNGEEFIKALEFANTFPKEVDWEAERPSVPTMIREGKLILMDVMISSVQEYQMYKGMFGEPVTFIGYPTWMESGSYIASSGSLLAMSSKSSYQDGVWQFIREGITKETQESESDYGYGFPVMKSALEKKFLEDMEEEYYEGLEGKVKEPKTTWGYDDFQIEIYAATQEEVAAVRELIETVETSYQYDTQLNTIIEEETAAFFEGQKSAKDVADIIQSRVQIYINENR